MAVDSRYRGIKTNQNDELEVLLALKRNIMNEFKTSSLGVVREVGESKYKVALFPTYSNEVEITIDCFKLSNVVITKGDVVLVIFTDRNFIQNLNQLRNAQKITKLDYNNVELHTYKYAIIIGKIL